mmetsp:Transcript_15137/g.38241  ORF Transcript_15137/g.38241 Transcript_15137/m.38241 type:complete len:95 (-) Transcript_15137:319-603(-)
METRNGKRIGMMQKSGREGRDESGEEVRRKKQARTRQEGWGEEEERGRDKKGREGRKKPSPLWLRLEAVDLTRVGSAEENWWMASEREEGEEEG